jgi:hypothetical protein
MLGVEILDPGRARAPWQVIERRVAFAQRDGMLFGNMRKKLAETPDSALVKGLARSAALEPESLQRRGIGTQRRGSPSREKEFQQVAARAQRKSYAAESGVAPQAMQRRRAALSTFCARENSVFASDIASAISQPYGSRCSQGTGIGLRRFLNPQQYSPIDMIRHNRCKRGFQQS